MIELASLPFAAIGLYALADQFDYRVPVNVHFRVIRDLSVAAGEPFVYENFFTRNRFCNTRVVRWFVGSDKVIRDIEPLDSAMPTEGLNQRQRSVAQIKTPHVLPPGPSKSCFQSHWQCTELQKLVPIDGPETCIDFIINPPPAALSLWLYPEPKQMTQASFALEGEP